MVASLTCHAQISVTYQGGTGTTVPHMVDSTGTALPDSIGNTVEIGYFDVGFNVAGNAGDLQTLASHWHLFDSTAIIHAFGSPSLPGAFSKTSPGISDSQFVSKQMDLWVFKTTDGLAPNFSTFANVSEYGLYTGASWVFPGTTVPPGSIISVATTGIDTAFAGSINPGVSLELAVVPEPSSLTLLGLGLGVCSLFGRRFRQ